MSKKLTVMVSSTVYGVEELLDRVVQRVPAPVGEANAPARAMIFDSVYDTYRGVVTYVRVVDGELNHRERIRMMSTRATHELLEVGVKLKPYVANTSLILNNALDDGKTVLFEGGQATMLDIDYGTYPYVTASHPISGGVGIGAGVAPQKIDKVVGIVKAYCTRVGEGPFPTEQLNAIGDKIREEGHEYGVVTGRPRRTGWLDACVVRYAGILSGIDYMAVTRLDILDSFDEIKMCTGYKYQGKLLNEIPASLKVLAEVEPVYETFPGWKTDITKVRKYEDLPENAKKYLTRMAEVTGIGLGIVSVGPNRDETIVIAKDIF